MTELGERAVGDGEIGGVVHRRAVGGVGERVRAERRRKGHRGRVGFDEEPVDGKRGEDGALPGGALGEEGAVEGEIGAEVGEFARELERAAVGVEEEAARGAAGAELGDERAPRVEAMDRDGEVARGGEVELPAEGGELFVEGGAAEAMQARVVGAGAMKDPGVEADLAEEGR